LSIGTERTNKVEFLFKQKIRIWMRKYAGRYGFGYMVLIRKLEKDLG